MDPMLQFFKYDHLPPHLQEVSKPFCELASQVVATLPRNPERTVCLRKLMEAKDCAVRSLIYKMELAQEEAAPRHTDPMRSARSVEEVIEAEERKGRTPPGGIVGGFRGD